MDSGALDLVRWLSWNWMTVAGLCGGLLNACCSNDLRLLPACSRTTSSVRLTRLGLLAYAGLGALSAAAVLWVHGSIDPARRSLAAEPLALASAYFLVGFLVCRAISNELDKALLRSAVRSAAAAPAAHPDVAKAFERVPPYAVYELAKTLTPRRHMPPSLRLPVDLHRAHPQRL